MAATPALSLAAASQAAFHGCVQAFMSSLSAKLDAAPKLREARLVGEPDPLRAFSSAPLELAMTAINPRDNRRVARATCTVTKTGEVLSLKTEPLVAL